MMAAMATEQRDWYDTPLYYDIIFDDGTTQEAEFLEAAFSKYGGKGRRVLEPACGSGRLALELARRGWNVFGFDGNANMIRFAENRLKEAGQKATLWEDWMQSFALPKKTPGGFDMAHCLVSTFKYLASEKDAVACLRRVAEALRPGGLFFLGLHLSRYDTDEGAHERWVARRENIEVVCNTRTSAADAKLRQEHLRTRLKITDSGRTHLQETKWTFRTYNAAQVKSLLRKVPELEQVACYDFNYDLMQPRKLDDSYADVLLVLRRV